MPDTIPKKVLFTGGGTLGPVSPLLALVPELRDQGVEVEFVGTPDGPERQPVEQAGLKFYTLQAPRLRRFWSVHNLGIPFSLIRGLGQASRLLGQINPQVIVSAGGFVSVPLVWMGRLRGIPAIIHQQDLRPGLANRLMQHQAKVITVAFESSKIDFPKSKRVEWIGNPVRDLTPSTHSLHLDQQFPTVLIFGGGTGAQALNALVGKSLCEQANVIHLTGAGKKGPNFQHPRYHQFEFLGEDMKEALAVADVVVSRAGLGTISELAALKKVALIIPLPSSHQEDNASWLEAHDAAVVFEQSKLDPDRLTRNVTRLLTDQPLRTKLSKNISKITRPDAAHRLVEIILEQTQRRGVS
ncbi:MAG: UDP-N-acetylglucosamine--N-acetylmuramyl-(pentapeptide) pyrophosphoryl-undecaprenol N-acetylglucosamine transferase [Patescibacteria group bacterium]